MIGLQRGRVKLVPHRKAWRSLFKQEKARIETALKSLHVHVAHIGSTAIPGIAAKPVIDILVGVHSMKDAEKCLRPLKKIGFQNIKDRGDPRRRLFFIKGGSSLSTHHLHIVKYGGKIWRGHTAFPHYLRTHKTLAKKYEALKKEAAKKFGKDRESYTTSKGKFVQTIIKRALKKKG